MDTPMRDAKPVAITEVSLRDGQQSLIATRLRTEDMLPLCEQLDQVGFWSLEVWGGATFDSCVRFLKEDPWARLRALRKALPNTRLQMLLRGQNLLGYRHYADDVVQAFVDRSAKNGIDIFRIFDAMNDVRNLETAIAAVRDAGKHAQGTICYTTSPVHTLDAFVQQAQTMVSMGCHSIAIKDMAGLLKPLETGNLVRELKNALQVPLFLHSHSTSGLAPLCQMKAIENGIDHIDTALSAFANGTSHPATESMVAALQDSPHDTGLDLELLNRISRDLREVRKKYHQFESEFTREDIAVKISQVPGGMMSNLANQLKEQGALERIDEVFEEIPRVRKDLGYPPLVTPLSQIVGTQAVMNVLAGGRYKTITEEVKLYLLGHYGEPIGEVDMELRLKAVGNAAAINARPADLLEPEMENFRAEIGSLADEEEDILTYAMFPAIGKEFLEQRRSGTLKPEELLQPNETSISTSTTDGTPTEFIVEVHGESYQVGITGVGVKTRARRRLYLTLDGVPHEVGFEPVNDYLSEEKASRKQATLEGHVTTGMPGNIVSVLVDIGDTILAGQPLLVTEAMKMEAEIQASIGGVIKSINVKKGDRVTPGEVLMEIG